MSDNAIDYAYEEKLKAEAGHRELWVEFSWGEERRVRTFPDTTEWNEALDLAAIAIVNDDPDVVRVWSVPMGARPEAASVELGQRAPIRGRGGPAGRGEDPAPQAAGRITSPSPCCEPVRSAGPSGIRFRHAPACRFRGEPYREGFVGYPMKSAARLTRRLAMETRRVGLDSDVATGDRAGGVLVGEPTNECPAHPGLDRWGCPICSERRT